MELLTIVPWFMGTEDFGEIFMFYKYGGLGSRVLRAHAANP